MNGTYSLVMGGAFMYRMHRDAMAEVQPGSRCQIWEPQEMEINNGARTPGVDRTNEQPSQPDHRNYARRRDTSFCIMT